MKKVQIKRSVDRATFKKLIDEGRTIWFFELKHDDTVEIAMIRVELEDSDRFFLRCPVRHVFRSLNGSEVATYVVDLPKSEIELVKEERLKWKAELTEKKALG